MADWAAAAEMMAKMPRPAGEVMPSTAEAASAGAASYAGTGGAPSAAEIAQLTALVRGAPAETLTEAAARGNASKVAALLADGADPSESDAEAWTPLIKATVGGHADVVALLLAAGAAVDPPAPGLHTAVRAASLFGRAAILRTLLAAGADPTVPSASARTPLMGACFPRDAVPDAGLECARALLADPRVRATVGARNSDGESALDLAAVRGSEKLAGLLRENGA